MNKTKDKIWLLAVVAIAVFLTAYMLSYIVTRPGHVLVNIAGDSAKNDFSYLYQSIYGKGFWFNGMNYPYGDNIVYADGQASLSVLLSYFKGISPELALTVLWLLIGLSYVLAIVFIYHILIHFKVAPAVGVIFACLICIFSPQVFRIGAHYGLSYLCVVPMLFYWTIKYNQSGRRLYCAYIFVLGVIMAFLHPYFAALVLIWVLSYVAGYFIFTKEKLAIKTRHALPVMASVVGLFATVAVIMSVTDPVKDRPVTPYGILVYTATKSNITTSIHSPIWKYFQEHGMFKQTFPNISDSSGQEGYCYIGLVVIFAIIFSLFKGAAQLVARNRTAIVIGEDKFSAIWLFMAIAALLFSMGVPFIWNMEWLLDYFSFLKQFRSLGRFSWIFYYIITVYAVVVIHARFANLIARRRFFDGYAILVLAMCIWSYEASGYVKAIRIFAVNAPGNYDMFFSKSEKNWNTYLKEHGLSSSDFQAIIMLDFFSIGSDKLWVGEPDWALTLACKASFQTRLPLVDGYLSRTSWSQSEKQVKTVAGPYADKPMLRDLTSMKPFLLLKYDNDSLDPDRKYLLQAADYIGHYSQCQLYMFYPERQIANDKKNADSILKIIPFMHAADTCIGNRGEWYVNHLDAAGSSDRLFGVGAMPRISGDDSTIAIMPIRPLTDSQLYEFSCWFLLRKSDYASPCVSLTSLDRAGKVIANVDLNTKWSVDNYNLWFRCSLYFPLRSDCRVIRCKVSNYPKPSYLDMDEILLRPADAVIISKAGDGAVMVNNHLLEKGAHLK